MTSISDTALRPAERPRISVVVPYPPSLTETFIRAHAERLPAEVVLVHGWRPSVGPRPVLSMPRIAFYKTLRVLTRSGLGRETTAAYLKVFRRHGIDAVLAEYGEMGVAVAPACKRAGIPLIVHFHGYDVSMHALLREYADLYVGMFAQAGALIAVSRAMHQKLVSLGASPEKVHYNPYGVDCSLFDGAEPNMAPPLFLAVGRFTEKKAPHLTIKAFAEAHRKLPDSLLRMIGEGPLLDACREQASQLGLANAVTFLGPQPPEVVQREMRLARCFVQHSLQASTGDSEGTPVAILEAGATGLPVVSTRHAGIPDVIVEGETGFLVDERDVGGMAQHMVTLAADPQLAASMGHAAQRRIRAHFSMERRLAHLWQIIESCMRNRDARTGPLRTWTHIAESS